MKMQNHPPHLSVSFGRIPKNLKKGLTIFKKGCILCNNTNERKGSHMMYMIYLLDDRFYFSHPCDFRPLPRA